MIGGSEIPGRPMWIPWASLSAPSVEGLPSPHYGLQDHPVEVSVRECAR